MTLPERLDAILEELPAGWTEARIVLTVPDPGQVGTAALILASLSPGRSGSSFHLRVAAPGGLGPSPGATRRVLARLDLTPFADRPLQTLSGGERQRAFLARALAQEAGIVLLDEPTSALDIGHQQEVLDLVDELRSQHGLTVLATMHDLAIAGGYADRLVLLAGGRVVACGTPAEVLTAEVLATHYGARVRVIPGDHGPIVVPAR